MLVCRLVEGDGARDSGSAERVRVGALRLPGDDPASGAAAEALATVAAQSAASRPQRLQLLVT